jgi:hypothetical protein
MYAVVDLLGCAARRHVCLNFSTTSLEPTQALIQIVSVATRQLTYFRCCPAAKHTMAAVGSFMLPQEILTGICAWLNGPALQNVRLISRTWNAPATVCLLHNIPETEPPQLRASTEYCGRCPTQRTRPGHRVRFATNLVCIFSELIFPLQCLMGNQASALASTLVPLI